MCLNMYFGIYDLDWLFMCSLFESFLVFIVIKLTNQVPNLWERVKIYFVAIPKSGFTTNFVY